MVKIGRCLACIAVVDYSPGLVWLIVHERDDNLNNQTQECIRFYQENTTPSPSTALMLGSKSGILPLNLNNN